MTDMEREQVLKLLAELRPGTDAAGSSDLIGDRILDSLSLTILITRLDQEFDIEITPDDLTPENFASVDTITELVKRLED
jgi:acyl carrier protein